MSELGMRPTTEFMRDFFKGRTCLNNELEGVELGVFKGLNAERMLDTLNIKKLHLVDIWITPECLKHQYNLEQFYLDVCEKFKNHSNVVIHRQDTLEVAKEFSDKSLDFVYVDADHTYLGCKCDILAWYPKIKKGGIICGHDYYCCEGVNKAVNDVFKYKEIITFDAIGMYDQVRYGEWLVIK